MNYAETAGVEHFPRSATLAGHIKLNRFPRFVPAAVVVTGKGRSKKTRAGIRVKQCDFGIVVAFTYIDGEHACTRRGVFVPNVTTDSWVAQR